MNIFELKSYELSIEFVVLNIVLNCYRWMSFYDVL